MVRIKERYLLVNLIYPPDPLQRKSHQPKVPDSVLYHQPTSASLTPQALLKAIRSEVRTLFGDYGAGVAELGLSIKYLSHATSTFILRVSRDHHRLIWAALTCMDRLPIRNGKPCIFRVVRASGTIKKAEEEVIRQAKQLILATKEKAIPFELGLAGDAKMHDGIQSSDPMDVGSDSEQNYDKHSDAD